MTTTPTPPPVARYSAYGLEMTPKYEMYAAQVVLATDYSRLAAECERLRRALEDAVDTLRMLRPFIRHTDSCDRKLGLLCNCGLRIVLDACHKEALASTSKEPQQ